MAKTVLIKVDNLAELEKLGLKYNLRFLGDQWRGPDWAYSWMCSNGTCPITLRATVKEVQLGEVKCPYHSPREATKYSWERTETPGTTEVKAPPAKQETTINPIISAPTPQIPPSKTAKRKPNVLAITATEFGFEVLKTNTRLGSIEVKCPICSRRSILDNVETPNCASGCSTADRLRVMYSERDPVRIAIVLPWDLQMEAKALAERMGISFSALTVIACADYMRPNGLRPFEIPVVTVVYD
jgi:hypothetical protein